MRVRVLIIITSLQYPLVRVFGDLRHLLGQKVMTKHHNINNTSCPTLNATLFRHFSVLVIKCYDEIDGRVQSPKLYTDRQVTLDNGLQEVPSSVMCIAVFVVNTITVDIKFKSRLSYKLSRIIGTSDLNQYKWLPYNSIKLFAIMFWTGLFFVAENFLLHFTRVLQYFLDFFSAVRSFTIYIQNGIIMGHLT